MQQRQIGPFSVSAIGLGCMNLSHAYGAPPPFEDAQALLHRALDLGISFFDTASLYGFGTNETLVGQVLAPHRKKFTLASKCGMTGVDGKRVIDGRPATIKRTCDESLTRLRTDMIDLYYLHRWDKQVPIEESVGAIADLVRAGKVRGIGLSEVSSATLRRAHAEHPITALQTEYSLWTRNPEIGVLNTCRELGVAFVAFSPVGRGFLGGTLREVAGFGAKDIRRSMPRFEPANYAANLKLADAAQAIARDANCTLAQLSLTWLLSRGTHIVPIPGTTNIAHLEENTAAAGLNPGPAAMAHIDTLINQASVAGTRYNAVTQTEIDTEEF